jgi:hypothetical protein
MDYKEVLAQLREEREKLDVAITSLERLEQGHRRGPGRPPNFVTKGHNNNINRSYKLPERDPDPDGSAA